MREIISIRLQGTKARELRVKVVLSSEDEVAMHDDLLQPLRGQLGQGLVVVLQGLDPVDQRVFDHLFPFVLVE